MLAKYKLIPCGNSDFYQICAVRDFSDVKNGDLGGLVYNEGNLSHEGNCWIYEGAKVYDHAGVSGDAKIGGSALVKELAQVTDSAEVKGRAVIKGSALIKDRAQVHGNMTVTGYTIVAGRELYFDDRILNRNQINTSSPAEDLLLEYSNNPAIYWMIASDQGAESFEVDITDDVVLLRSRQVDAYGMFGTTLCAYDRREKKVIQGNCCIFHLQALLKVIKDLEPEIERNYAILKPIL